VQRQGIERGKPFQIEVSNNKTSVTV
jgi:hypothetical protein